MSTKFNFKLLPTILAGISQCGFQTSKLLPIVCAVLLSQPTVAATTTNTTTAPVTATPTLAATPKSVLPIQHWFSSNGAAVYFVNAPEVPILDIMIAFDAGSSRDGKQEGIARFTNALLNQGTKTLNADQIADNFDQVGASFSNNTDKDSAILSLRTLTDPKYMQPALQTFKVVLTEANFPLNALNRQQKNTLNAIEEQQQSPSTIANDKFFEAVYVNHPYAHPVLGTAQSVMTFTQADVQKFYQNYYQGKNAVVVIVGSVDRKAAETIVNDIIGSLPAGRPAATLPVPVATKNQTIKLTYPASQCAIRYGQLGINHQDPHYFPLVVGNTILGGDITSRLASVVREQNGLTYDIGSYFIPMIAKGPFLIGMQSRNEQANLAMDLTRSTLQSYLQQGPSETELKSTKQYLIGSFPLRLASNNAIAANLLSLGRQHLPLNYFDTYRDNIAAVTAPQIHQALQQQINMTQMVTVMVGQ